MGLIALRLGHLPTADASTFGAGYTMGATGKRVEWYKRHHRDAGHQVKTPSASAFLYAEADEGEIING